MKLKHGVYIEKVADLVPPHVKSRELLLQRGDMSRAQAETAMTTARCRGASFLGSDKQ